MNNLENLKKKYTFQNQYVENFDNFKEKIKNKTIIPYQVEFQPPPKSTKKICWLECPYCYGLSALDNGERFSKIRSLEILKEILLKGVKKIIFAGYATDPLNCDYIDDLLELTIKEKAIFGFNTKALKVSERFIDILSQNQLTEGSYISLSVDAGTNETYKKIHNISTNALIYDNVLNNVKKIGRIKNNKYLDLSAAYLVNIHSSNKYDYEKFINDFISAGCNVIRFTFPQPPKDIKTEKGVVPTREEISYYLEDLNNLKKKYESEKCLILVIDPDNENETYFKPRTIPCYARFIFPTVGFDGWLYNCSQSSSPNFRPTALGDLNKSGFWDLFYNYATTDLEKYLDLCNQKIANSGCRCDRKEHVVNQSIINSKVF
jgi:sulfatase maturation enzyme AslB (radical SAM superfamily)